MPATPKGRFVPMPAVHPSLGSLCPLCDQPIETGQVPTAVDDNQHPFWLDETCVNGLHPNLYYGVIYHETCYYPKEH